MLSFNKGVCAGKAAWPNRTPVTKPDAGFLARHSDDVSLGRDAFALC